MSDFRRRHLFGIGAAVSLCPAILSTAPIGQPDATPLAVAPVALPAAATADPDALLAAIGREALPLLREYERLNDEWFTLENGTPDVDRVGDAADAILERLWALRDQADTVAATSFLGFQAKAVFGRVDMLIECSRKDGMQFDGTAQKRLWDFLGELTQAGAA